MVRGVWPANLGTDIHAVLSVREGFTSSKKERIGKEQYSVKVRQGSPYVSSSSCRERNASKMLLCFFAIVHIYGCRWIARNAFLFPWQRYARTMSRSPPPPRPVCAVKPVRWIYQH